MSGRGMVAVVAGSGIDLTGLLDDTDDPVPFRETGDGPPGHPCVFVRGRCGLRDVIVQQGRFHAYEGFNLDRLVRPIDALYAMGVRAIVFTNAAGGLRPEMEPGQLAAATEVVAWPFRRFVLPDTIPTDFAVPGCDHAGTHAWMHGPCYETRAEIHALQCARAATVGMSAAPELARCRELGVRAAVVSCITNNCCAVAPLSHEHVLDVAAKASRRLAYVLRTWLGREE